MIPAKQAFTRPALVGTAVALLSLAPLLGHLPAFRALFYFQDEWDLIDLWDKTGFSAWVSTTFAENFVPLFKLAWGGAIVLGGGSYFVLIVLLWLTHAFNVFLVFRLSARFSGSLLAATFAGSVFGLAWVNYETLTWTVQWSAVLSLSFLLLALDQVLRWSESSTPDPWRAALTLGLCTTASALCFSRGVLTGVTLAAWVMLAGESFPHRRSRLLVAAAALLPALLVSYWIFRHSSGNHHHLRDAAVPMLAFALHYYAQAPLRTLWSDATPAVPVIALLAAIKTAIFALALWLAPRRLRPALAALWLFEIGNALLLGLGRYHTGLGASGSSRYQYGALAAFLPACAMLFSRGLGLLPGRWALRPLVGTVAVLVLAWNVQTPWGKLMASWSEGRGGGLRQMLARPSGPETPEHITQLPWMSNERAREIAQKYRLH